MTEFLPFSEEHHPQAAERFVAWLTNAVLNKARGADRSSSHDRPFDKIWLGRIAPMSIAAASGRDDRLERMEPCAIGFKLRPACTEPWKIRCVAKFVLWKREAPRSWRKSNPVEVEFETIVDSTDTSLTVGK